MLDFKQLERSEKKEIKKDKKQEQLSYQKKKEDAREKRRLKNRISKFEKQIDRLEKELQKLDEQLADPEQFQKLSKEKDFFEKYEQNQKRLKQMIQDWESTLEQLEHKKV